VVSNAAGAVVVSNAVLSVMAAGASRSP
jgi:hypothetical protein